MSAAPTTSTPTQVRVGVIGTITGLYPPVVTLGQGGFPAKETGPKAIPPGAGFSLPTLVFGGPWQH